MQGQRNSSQPFYEIDFDQASNSNNSAMDRQMFWNDPIYNSEENRDLPSNPLSPNGTSNSCRNAASQEAASLSIWDPLGPSSSMPPLNEGNLDCTKLESGWTLPSSRGNRSSGPRIREIRSEANNTLSFGNDDTELNSNRINNREPFSQFLNFSGLTDNLAGSSENFAMSNQVLESGIHQELYNPGLLQHQHIALSSSSSGTFENSSRAIDFFSNNGGDGQGVALGDQCSSHKRKNIEGIHGESSASASSRNLNQGINLVEEGIGAKVGTITRVAASENLPYGRAAGKEENFQRNTRKRIIRADSANTSTPNPWSQPHSVTHFSAWPASQLSSPAVSSSQSLDSSLARGNNAVPSRQCALPTIPIPAFSPGVISFPPIGTSSTEVGSSSGLPTFAVDGESGELNSTIDPSTISDQAFALPHNTRHSGQDHTNWGLANGSTILSGNAVPTSQAGTNIGVYQSPGSNWVSHQRRRRLSEAVFRSFFPAGAEHRGRIMNLPPRHGHSSTSQEVGRHQSGAVSRANQHPYMRLPNMLPRQNDGSLGIPLSIRALAASREGRNRISEIRNMFDLIRRGDGLLLEDVLLFEQSVFIGGGNFQDRYRDMRLDVDNMSYEELLALGERIGSVNTGLTEEKVLKCLRQRKYISLASEPSSEEVEPCCICREEYVEGDDLGRLDCGHDFHTSCIKQWLMIKNLCPICKTTALCN